MEDILPLDLVDQLCALQLEGEENWELTFSFRATTKVVGSGEPPRER